MSIPPREAADALHSVEQTQCHSATAYGYQRSSGHLFLWGIIWIIGYAVTYVRPHWYFLWIVLMVIGILGSFWVGHLGQARAPQRAFGWRYAATFIAIFLFIVALFAILPPQSSLQIDAFFPLLIAIWYVLMGIWMRANRMALLGLVLGLLTVGGYFWLQHYFPLWMAGVGGGALILGGFWLRRV